MQATTTPKLADQRPAAQAVLAVVLLAFALIVGGTIGIALQSAAPATPAAVIGDYEASGVRRGIDVSAADRALDGAAFRNPAKAAVLAPTVGGLVYTGANPGTSAGSVASDDMAQFNGIGLSKPGADETQKVGRAHR